MDLEPLEKYQMREQLELYEASYELRSKAQSWSEQSQSHLNLALLLLEEGLYRPSLILAHMGLKLKLKQIYLQVAGKIPPEQWLFDDLVSHTRDYTGMNLDTELFLSTIHFISEDDQMTLLNEVAQSHVLNMFQRLEEIFVLLNSQMMNVKLKVQMHM